MTIISRRERRRRARAHMAWRGALMLFVICTLYGLLMYLFGGEL